MAANFQAATFEDLRSQLQSTDISVSPRTNGRTTGQTETFTACHLLAALAGANQLKFPVSLTHRDRPDFLLTESGAETGIEITEAITKQFAAFCALAEREGAEDVLLELAHFRWGAPELSLQQMRQLLNQERLSSDGWAGDGPEREWASSLQNLLVAKLKKLAKVEFCLYSQNWLSVYDNLPLPNNLDLDVALRYLRPLLAEHWTESPSFHAIYVHHHHTIIKLTPNTAEKFEVNDLWPDQG